MTRGTRIVSALALWATGCFGPDIAEGLACGPDDACPPGQRCDPSGRCAVDPDSIDGSVDTTPDADPNPPDADTTVIDLDTEVSGLDISGMEGCTLSSSNGSRNVGLGSTNRIYAVFACGVSSDGFAVVSEDGGDSFSAPFDLQIGKVDEIAVAGVGATTALAAALSDKALVVTMTFDAGATWSAPLTLDDGMTTTWGVSIATSGTRVLVAVRTNSTTLTVWRNDLSAADGLWASTDVADGTVRGDVVVDPAGSTWLIGDDPDVFAYESTDGGATFPTAFSLNHNENESDWSFAAGLLIGSGDDERTHTVPPGDPSLIEHQLIGLPNAVAGMRSVSGAANTAFIATQRAGAGGGVQLDRVVNGAIQATRSVDGVLAPAVVADVGRTALMVYEDSAGRILFDLHLF